MRRPIKKVLLISPYRTGELYPPLGLAYLAAYIRERGHEPEILDCAAEAPEQVETVDGENKHGLSDAQLARRVADAAPGLIGITSNFTPFHDDARRAARICKQALPAVPVVMGGAHASLMDGEAMSDPSIDFVIRGEGEVSFHRLLAALSGGGPLTGVEGLTWRDDGAIVRNPDHAVEADLDSLPMPAYDLLDMAAYLKDQRKTLFPFAKRTPVGFMVTSRGCPFHCTFCSTTKNWKKYRYRSAKKVVDEMEHLKDRYGVREIAFQDDSFLAKKTRVMEICREIGLRRLTMPWTVPPGSQVWIINNEMLHAMQKSGLYRISFPIESGNQRSLDYIRKPVNLKKALAVIEECNRIGLWCIANFIIGFPRETREEIRETIAFMNRSNIDMCSLYIAQPFAGSPMYDEYARLGLLNDGKAAHGSSVFKTKYDTLEMRADELNRIREEAVSAFMGNKARQCLSWRGFRRFLWPKINSPEKLGYFALIAGHVLKTSLKKGRLALFD